MDTSPYLLWGCVQNDWAEKGWSTHGSQSRNLWSSLLYKGFSPLSSIKMLTYLHTTDMQQQVQWATVLSLWEYFILLFWTLLPLHIFSLTFVHVLCLTSLLNTVWTQWSLCSIVCTIGSNTFWLLQCTSVNSRSLSKSRPAKLSFLTQLICKHNLHCQKCY